MCYLLKIQQYLVNTTYNTIFVFPDGHSHSSQDTENHTVFVWRGFVALAALVLFFLAEKMINMLGEWRERRRAMHREKKVRIVR